MPFVDRVVRVERCDLAAIPGRWPYQDTHGDAIATHWEKRHRQSPGLFNGIVHLLSSWHIEGGTFSGRFLKTDFASFLHWRESGHPDAGVRDCFGTAIIRSAEGNVLLGRQRPGQVNSGLLYPPSGFIDPADVGPGGRIDIVANIAREVSEETGLAAARLSWPSGFRICFSGAQVAIAREGCSTLAAAALRAAVLDFIAGEAEPELVDVVMVQSPACLGGDTPAYARTLLGSLFSEA